MLSHCIYSLSQALGLFVLSRSSSVWKSLVDGPKQTGLLQTKEKKEC